MVNLSPEIEALLEQLRQKIAGEYERGGKDAANRIIQAAQGSTLAVQRNGHDSKQQVGSRVRTGKRAPSGAAPALVNRVLGECGSKGATALEIQESAKSAIEKQVSYSGIRFALTQGRDKGNYHNKNGRWYLRPKNKTAEQEANA